MKLCSVCDKKISGSWCKNCHRFVKTYQLPDGIHLNESHNPKNDESCTYHMPDPAVWNMPATPRNTQTVSRNTQTTARSTQTTARNTQTTARNTQTTARNTQTTARNTQSASPNTQSYGSNTGTQKKKPAKNKAVVAIVVVIIVFYALFVAATTFMPLVMDVIDDLTPEKRYEEEREDDKNKDKEGTNDREEDSALAEAKRKLEEVKRLAALQRLQPLDTSEDEEGWQYSFYNPEEIQNLEFECNIQEHFDITLSGFTAWLEQNFDGTYEESESVDKYRNYLTEGEGESWYCFSSYHDYLISNHFAIRVDYDTAVKTIHGIMVLYVAEEDHTELCYHILKMFDPETDWSEEDFSKQVEEVLRTGEYTEMYSSDFLGIAAQTGEGVLSLIYYPSYEQ